ncbi:unnamed protein product [Effrenium voratum]|nr:unnamed protein product [Effrenium voratum]
MARLSTAAEQVQCTLMPCLCCKALAAAEATCRDLQKLIATGDFWSQCFHVALPDFELAGDFLGTLTKEGDTESRAQLKRLLGTFWALTVKDQSLIDLQGMRLPLTSSVARQLLSKVEQAKAKTRRRPNGVPGRVLLRHIRFREDAQAPLPYRGTEVICRACEPIFFTMESPHGGVQQLALQLKWVENEVRIRVMYVEGGRWPYPVPPGWPSRTLSVDVLALCKEPLLATRGSQVTVAAGWYPTSGITAALMPSNQLWPLLEQGLSCVIAVADFVESHNVCTQATNLSYVNCLSLQFP